MRKPIFIIFFITLGFSTFSQNGFRNYGNTIKIANGTSLKIYNSDFTNNDTGKVYNDGNIYLEGDIYNNASNNCFANRNNTGNVILNGTNTQQISGTGESVYFENLIINNSSLGGVEITNNNQFVENNLILNDGIISTNTNTLIVNNSDATAISGYSSNSYINGTLRRYLSSNTDTYAFPVGNGNEQENYFLAELINHNLTGVNYIDASFEDLIGFDFENLNAEDLSSMAYTAIKDEGVWELTPDNSISSGTYDLKLHTENIQGLTDNRFAILSRPNISTTAADWSCEPCGISTSIGLPPDNSPGRLVSDGFALRKGFDHFTQFGIAVAACPTPNLPDDTTICYGDSIMLYPGDFESYTWSTGSQDTAIYVSNQGEYFVDVTTNIAGCETASDTVELNVSKIEAEINVKDVTCYG